MKKLLFISILLIALLSFSVNAVSYENSKFKLTVTPDIAYNWHGNFEQYYTLTSKINSDVCVNAAFAFEQKLTGGGIYPKKINNQSKLRLIWEQVSETVWNSTTQQNEIMTYFNNTRNETYYEVSTYYSTNKVSTTYNNLDPTAYGFISTKNNVYIVDNKLCIKAGETLEGKWNYKTSGSGKWDLLIYTNDLTHKIELDPYFNNSRYTHDFDNYIDIDNSTTTAAIDTSNSKLTLFGGTISTDTSQYILYDDFTDTEGTNLQSHTAGMSGSGWTVSYGQATISNNRLKADTSDEGGYINFNETLDITKSVYIEFQSIGGPVRLQGYNGGASQTYFLYWNSGAGGNMQAGAGGTTIYSGGTLGADTWYSAKIQINDLNNTYDIYIYNLSTGVELGSVLSTPFTTNSTITQLNIQSDNSNYDNLRAWNGIISEEPIWYNASLNYLESLGILANDTSFDTSFKTAKLTLNSTNDTAISYGMSCNNGTSWLALPIDTVTDCASSPTNTFKYNITLDGNSVYSPTIYDMILDFTYTNTKLTSFGLFHSKLNDYTSDGANYGETSEGWASGESTLKNITALNINSDSILYIRYSELNEILNIFDANTNIALINIPSTASGIGNYKFTSVHINSSQYINSNILSLNISAPSSNTDPVYIDYIALTPIISNTSIISNGSNLAILSNISGVFALRGYTITNSSNVQVSNSTVSNNTIDDYNTVSFYTIPQNIDDTYTFKLYYNSSDDTTNIFTSTLDIILDGNYPIIDTISTDTDILINQQTNITVKLTELNPKFVQIQTNDSSFTTFNLTVFNISASPNNWTGAITYTDLYTKNLTIITEDNVSHRTITSINIRSSNASYTNDTIITNTTYSYTNNIIINDASTTHDEILISPITIISSGTAYIDSFNISYTILDAKPKNISLSFANTTNLISQFQDDQTLISWFSESWNDTANNGNTTFITNLTYLLDDAIITEWENTGVGDERLFRVNPSNITTNLTSMYFNITLRTAYDGLNDRLQLKECTGNIDWDAKTCSQWTVRTTLLYYQNDTTYHSGLVSEYPTLDTDGDSNKDTVVLKLSISGQTEQMWSLNLDSGTAETVWTVSTTSNTSASTSGSGGSSTTAPILSSSTSTLSTPQKSKFSQYVQSIIDAIKPLTDFLGNLFGVAINFISGLFSSLTAGVGEGQSFFILVIMIVLAMSFLLISGGNGGNKKTRGDFSL